MLSGRHEESPTSRAVPKPLAANRQGSELFSDFADPARELNRSDTDTGVPPCGADSASGADNCVGIAEGCMSGDLLECRVPCGAVDKPVPSRNPTGGPYKPEGGAPVPKAGARPYPEAAPKPQPAEMPARAPHAEVGLPGLSTPAFKHCASA